VGQDATAMPGALSARLQQKPATGRALVALTSVQIRTAAHYNRKWLRLRANISRSTAHAYFLLPKPPRSSRLRRLTSGACWPASVCTGSRWVPCGPSSPTTSRRSNARGGLRDAHASSPRSCQTRLQPSSASEPTPGPIECSEGADADPAESACRRVAISPGRSSAEDRSGCTATPQPVRWRPGRRATGSPTASHPRFPA
jgi:hypothetical protein